VPHQGQEIQGADGFRLLLVRVDDEALEMEASYGGGGGMPPEHLHPRQVERFEVLEGAMQTRIDGAEQRYEVGEEFSVPAGTPHTMAADGPARVRWTVEPALRTAEFFERLHGDGPDSARAAGASIGDWLAEFREEIRFTGA
jgi:quercetin dioxygenase-like cupin family protein